MWEFDYFPFFIDFHYHNLVHDPIQIDMQHFVFNFTHMAADEAPVVYTRMPLIEDWTYTFDYNYKLFGFKFGGTMKLQFAGIDFLTTSTFHATDSGLVYP